MTHATLQIKTSSHRALRKKTLAVIKDSSGKPILFCSLTPRSKKRNKGAKSHTFKKCVTQWGMPVPSMRFLPVESGGKSISPKGVGAKRKKSLFFSVKPWAVAQGVKQKKESSFSAQGGSLATRGKLKQQSKSFNGVQQRYAQKRTQRGVKRTAASKWNGFAPFLALRSCKPQSQRRRRLIVSFLKELASRQSTTLAYEERRATNRAVAPCFAPIPFGERLFAPRKGLKGLYAPLPGNVDALNTYSKRMTHPALPLNNLGCVPIHSPDQNPSGGDLFKSLRGNFSPRLRHKSLDLEAKLLGLKLGKACIFKAIQSIDVVIQEYTKPTCLLLQGLRMAGVRFNRLRILRAADYNYDVNSVSDYEMKRLGLARENLRPFFPSLKGSNFEKLSNPNPHVPFPFEKSNFVSGASAPHINPLPGGSDFIRGTSVPHFVPLPIESNFIPLSKETKTVTGGNRSDCVSWLLDVSPKNELLQILVKSRLIKKSTRHTFWQARSFKYKIEKLLYRKNRRGAIRERVYCPFIQKKAVKKWKAFTDFSTVLKTKEKEQAFVQRTPFYRLRRSFAPFLSKSSSTTYHLPPKARKRVKQRVAWLRPKKFYIFEKYGSSLQKSRSFQKRPRFRVNQTRIIANVQNTLNNTIITITDRFGNTKVWCSSGSIGLKASRRSTNYAAQSVAEAVAKKCRKLGIRRVEVRVQGVGYGKPSALKGLRIGGLQIKRIVDTTSKPHNGCRAPKKRRV